MSDSLDDATREERNIRLNPEPVDLRSTIPYDRFAKGPGSKILMAQLEGRLRTHPHFMIPHHDIPDAWILAPRACQGISLEGYYLAEFGGMERKLWLALPSKSGDQQRDWSYKQLAAFLRECRPAEMPAVSIIKSDDGLSEQALRSLLGPDKPVIVLDHEGEQARKRKSVTIQGLLSKGLVNDCFTGDMRKQWQLSGRWDLTKLEQDRAAVYDFGTIATLAKAALAQKSTLLARNLLSLIVKIGTSLADTLGLDKCQRIVNLMNESSYSGYADDRTAPDALCWLILGEDGTISYAHVDANGESTDAATAEGLQIWFLVTRMEAAQMLHEFHKDRDRADWWSWAKERWVYWILLPGQILYMGPGQVHGVYGVHPRLGMGNHSLLLRHLWQSALSQLTDKLVGLNTNENHACVHSAIDKTCVELEEDFIAGLLDWANLSDRAQDNISALVTMVIHYRQFRESDNGQNHALAPWPKSTIAAKKMANAFGINTTAVLKRMKRELGLVQ